ncbi:transmembrane protein, putative [Rhizoctonia solani AG-3 Rhs1AP]|uniref:Transmembrane protein, putative n=2 Tax=Rhizoctonia solani AG-3 TaxID=1086053 RepID=X8JEI6_9AGAM|nr:transmembrane protein, putative [Rhizoctonia solani AG-3 Rhs1AP]KEP53358.1 putative transmembrane protein [Rhizoctonia solani 123E]
MSLLPRAPIRTRTFDHEGWIRAQQQVACPPPPKPSPPNTLLANPRWQTDIVTFCSHIARDPHLGRAQITQIQNRKSHRLPSLNEYLLLFFSVDQRRFVARVDYTSRTSTGKEALLLGGGVGCKQQVTVYHVPLEGEATPWCEEDAPSGSELVAALTTWSSLGASGMSYVSHHLATAQEGTSSQGPRLHDVARLVEAVILESPAHYFKAASSYVTCRSTLGVIHNCFPHEFACSLGKEHELVPASMLEEPAWASLLRWYFPFMTVAVVLYAIAVVSVHVWVGRMLDPPQGGNVLDVAPKCMRDPSAAECDIVGVVDPVWKMALRLVLHLALDLPFPVGLVHTWLASLELETDQLVKRVTARYLNLVVESSEDKTNVKTWLGTFSRPWFNFIVGSCLGCVAGLALYLGILLGHGVITLLGFVLCVTLGVNYLLPALGDSEPVREQPDDGLALEDRESRVVRSSDPGPSSSSREEFRAT